MVTTHFSLCALPGPSWERQGPQPLLHSFVTDALASEKRMQHSVNLDNEYTRYTTLCGRIADIAAPHTLMTVENSDQFKDVLVAHSIPVYTLSAGYLDVLVHLTKAASKAGFKASEHRLGAMFFPPHLVAHHRTLFTQLAKACGLEEHADVQRRIEFFRLAEQSGCGIIELQNTFVGTESSRSPWESSGHSGRDKSVPMGIDMDEEEDTDYDSYTILRSQLLRAMHAAGNGQRGIVTIGSAPHAVITEVLHELIYRAADEDNGPRQVCVVYGDGTLSQQPLQLRCLSVPTEDALSAANRSRSLHVALMSMRHFRMDRDVERDWFRNAMMSHMRPMAETDAVCYQYTLRELQALRAEGDITLHLYQQGTQPAIIGFYRALTEELLCRRSDASAPRLALVPHYYDEITKYAYQDGHVWL